VLVERHRAGFALLDLSGRHPHGVGPLDGTADPPLGDHLQHACPGEQRDMPVQAAGGHVVKLGGELARGQRTVAEKCLDDAQPHRVEEKISAYHRQQSSNYSQI
jgi:hypothetical protein